MNNSYFWADWYIGYYGLNLESKDAFHHFQKDGFELKFNPNPLISCWWVEETFGISSYKDFHNHINSAKRSHPFFDVEIFPANDDVWKFYTNNAFEMGINPCTEVSLLQLKNFDFAQNRHFIDIFLILENAYKNFLKFNGLKDNINTRVSFITSL